jgi:hypothetical protein
MQNEFDKLEVQFVTNKLVRNKAKSITLNQNPGQIVPTGCVSPRYG